MSKYETFQRSLGINLTCPPEALPEVLFLGLSAECGEVCNELSKSLWQERKLDRGALCSELGDVLWYIAMIGDYYDISLENMMEDNMHKRLKRASEQEEDREVELYTLARMRSAGAI